MWCLEVIKEMNKPKPKVICDTCTKRKDEQGSKEDKNHGSCEKCTPKSN